MRCEELQLTRRRLLARSCIGEDVHVSSITDTEDNDYLQRR